MNEQMPETGDLPRRGSLPRLWQSLKQYADERQQLFWGLHCLIIILFGWWAMIMTGLPKLLLLSVLLAISNTVIRLVQFKAQTSPRLAAFRHLGPELEFAKFLFVGLTTIGAYCWIVNH